MRAPGLPVSAFYERGQSAVFPGVLPPGLDDLSFYAIPLLPVWGRDLCCGWGDYDFGESFFEEEKIKSDSIVNFLFKCRQVLRLDDII